MPESFGVRAERDGLPGRGDQPGGGFIGATAVAPMPGDQGRRAADGRQPAGGVAVNPDPVVRGELLDEGPADQIVPEPVAGVGDDQGAGREGGVEQREGLRFCQPGQGPDMGRVQVVAGDREAAQQRGGGHVEIEEPRRHRVPDRRRHCRSTGDGGARQLQGEEGVALRQLDDPGQHRRLRCHGCAGLDQRGHLAAVERAEIDPDHAPCPVQRVDPVSQGGAHDVRAMRQDADHGQPAGGAGEEHAGLDGGVVGQVRVVEDQQHAGGGAPTGVHQPANGADHHVPGEPALGAVRRRCQRDQRRSRPVPDGVEQAAVAAQELPDGLRQGGVRAAPGGGCDRDSQPTALPCLGRDAPAQRRFADPSRTAHHQRSQLAPLRGRNRGRGPSQLQLPAHEGRHALAEPGDALLVERPAFGAGRQPELTLQGCTQTPVPADRGGSIPAHQGRAHELPMGLLVGRLNRQQPLPLPAQPQQLDLARSQPVPLRLRPLLIQHIREQVTGVHRRRSGAGHAIPRAQRRLRRPLEALHIGLDLERREQRDPATAQHDRVRPAQRLTGVVSRLTQVRRPRLQPQVRPERLGHLLPLQTAPFGQGEQLHQLRGPPTRPHGIRELVPVDHHPEAPKQLNAHLPAPLPRSHESPFRRPDQASGAYRSSDLRCPDPGGPRPADQLYRTSQNAARTPSAPQGWGSISRRRTRGRDRRDEGGSTRVVATATERDTGWSSCRVRPSARPTLMATAAEGPVQGSAAAVASATLPSMSATPEN